MSGVRFVEVVDGVVVRHALDEVNNNLTARLRWCSTHVEPVWVFGDGSYTCPQTLVVEWDTQDHVIVDVPWTVTPWR